MSQYFQSIVDSLKTFLTGMGLTWKHFVNKKDLVVTLQYPNEKWPIPDRNIGFNNEDYNLIRSRLHVDMDDCIGCLQCERACPVDCIKIDTIKPTKGNDFDCGTTSGGTNKRLMVPRFTIDMSECMYCNLCVNPCPEECIYMVGGPNSEKHDIDYEFSQYSRDGMIFEFANSSDQDIKDFGGEKYLELRDEKLLLKNEDIDLSEPETELNDVNSASLVKEPDTKKQPIKKIKTKSYSSDQKIGLFYGSSTGNSEAICDKILEELGDGVIELYNVAESDPEKILEFNHIIISCPTWYEGELQEDWIEFLPKISALDLNGKKIVMFGMGDQAGYADNFLDALGIIAEDLIKAGAGIEGAWPTDGYDFTKSLGLAPSGDEFYGLGLDEENQADLHDSRLEKWYEMLVKVFNLNVEKIERNDVQIDVGVSDTDEPIISPDISQDTSQVDASIKKDKIKIQSYSSDVNKNQEVVQEQVSTNPDNTSNSEETIEVNGKLYQLVPNIGSNNQDTDIAIEDKPALVEADKVEVKSQEIELFDIKKLDFIDNKMARGTAKKIHIAGKRNSKTSKVIIDEIIEKLSTDDLCDDDMKQKLEGLCG